MRSNIWIMGAAVLVRTYAQTPELAVIQSAANALGGLERVRAVKTLIVEGEGTNPNVGQNRNPNDPLLDWKVTEYKKTIDLAGGRMRLQQHRQAQFAFAMANDVRQNMVLDGDIAFNVDASGKASRAPEAAVRDRRIEMLDNPVAMVRAALDPGTRLAHLRSEAKVQLLDLNGKRRRDDAGRGRGYAPAGFGSLAELE